MACSVPWIYAHGGHRRNGEGLEQFAAQAPAGRPATADEIAEAIVFLATDRSSFIYGAKLAVDGGAQLFEKVLAFGSPNDGLNQSFSPKDALSTPKRLKAHLDRHRVDVVLAIRGYGAAPA
jgi:enoyl-ACP reductase-like protein